MPLTTISLVLSLMLLLRACGPDDPVVDSYCTMYEEQGRIVQNAEDAAVVKTLPRRLQLRIARQEVAFACICDKWGHSICKGK